jgi:hypothetical protein
MARQVSRIISHWHQLIEGLQESPQAVYTQLDQAIAKRDLPKVKLSRVKHRESGLFSSKRLYYRVSRKELIFDICAAPYGRGFFVSWWLGDCPVFLWFLLYIPILGRLVMWLFHRETYWKIDTALMFQDSVHAAVLEVLDDLIKAQGLRALSELERKPVMRELFKR